MVRKTEVMTEVRPAANAKAAEWLLRSDVDWWDLVRYGPPGFDVYVRVAFAQDGDVVDLAGEDPALRRALATLAEYTATPQRIRGDASQALAKALRGAVRRVHYLDPAPLYRDPP